jgi:hypothetical protein
MTAEEWTRLKEIRAAAPPGAEVTAREHVGYERSNDDPDDPEITRRSIRVDIPFAGQTYRREYAV